MERGGGEGENERTRSLPLSPSSRPSIFFFCVNFFPALCYLNAWNRLVERIWEGGGGGTSDNSWFSWPYFQTKKCRNWHISLSFLLIWVRKTQMTPVVPVVARSGTCLYGFKKGVPPPPLPGGKEHRSFFEKISVLPYVRESKTVLSSFDARDSVFRNICQWNMDTVSQSLVGFLIPWAVFRIPKPRMVDFTAKIQWLPNSTSKNFPDSWIQIALVSLPTLPLIPKNKIKILICCK